MLKEYVNSCLSCVSEAYAAIDAAGCLGFLRVDIHFVQDTYVSHDPIG